MSRAEMSGDEMSRAQKYQLLFQILRSCITVASAPLWMNGESVRAGLRVRVRVRVNGSGGGLKTVDFI